MIMATLRAVMRKRTLQDVLITSCPRLGSAAVGTASRQALQGAGGIGSARGSSDPGVLRDCLAASLIPWPPGPVLSILGSSPKPSRGTEASPCTLCSGDSIREQDGSPYPYLISPQHHH